MQLLKNLSIADAQADYSLPLRICHLGKYYPPAAGGIETHVQTLARAQAALGASVRVVCVDHTGCASPPEHGRQLGSLNAWCESDGPVRVTRASRRASFNRLDICPDLPETLRTLEREHTDVLHLHTPNPTMLLAVAMVRPNIPLVITHHSDIIRQKVLRLALRPFERFVYARAARIQATTPIYRENSQFLSRYNGSVEVLPLGVDRAPFSHPGVEVRARARELQAEHGSPLWLCVGRLVYYKAFHVAIEALTRVAGNLIIIGTGPLEKELKELADRLGVSRRICWHGYLSRDELAAYYRAATALWFPSNARSEAFGLVQVEAMASSCPVINTDIAGSGVAWVSRHETSGLTIPINDPAALAAAAQRLIDQPGLRNRLACGAHRRAAEEFDHLMMARRSLAIYRRAIRGEPAPVMIDPAPVARETSVDDFDLGADLLGLGLLAAGRDQQPDNIPQAVGELRGTNYQNESSAPLFREPLRRD